MTDFETVKREAGNALHAMDMHEGAADQLQNELNALLAERPDIAERIRGIAYNKRRMAESKKTYTGSLSTLRKLGIQAHNNDPANRSLEGGLIEITTEKNAILGWNAGEAEKVGRAIVTENPALFGMLFTVSKEGFKHLAVGAMSALVPDTVMRIGVGYKASVRKGKERLLGFADPEAVNIPTLTWSTEDGLQQVAGPLQTVNDGASETLFNTWSGKIVSSEEAYLLNCADFMAWEAGMKDFPYDALDNVTKFMVQQIINTPAEVLIKDYAEQVFQMLGLPYPERPIAAAVVEAQVEAQTDGTVAL